jgi:lipopolysaccharide transport system permease protein
MINQDNWLFIRASKRWSPVDLREIWRYRELVVFLAWRDVAVRYKQTILGVLWVVLQPLLSSVIFTVIFGNLIRVPSDGNPYAIFALVGLLPWNFFSSALTRGGGSVVVNANLISKVYFPRVIIPLSSLLSSLVDFFIVTATTGIVLLVYGITWTPALFLLPLFTGLAFLVALGASLWLSALNVMYRDVGFLLPFIAQIWFYLTPVVYPASIVPEQWQWLMGLNPMAGVIDGFRWALLGAVEPNWGLLLVSAGIAIVILISGAMVFRQMERRFADII